MARRKRTNKLIESMAQDPAPAAESPAEVKEESVDTVLAPNRVTPEVEASLEMLETLKASNSQLFQEKSDLTDELSNQIQLNSQLKNEVEQLKAKVNELQHQLAEEKKSFETVQAQSDEYLLKISDMSYELAQLRTQTSVAEVSHKAPKPIQGAEIPSNQKAFPPSPSEVVYKQPPSKKYKRLLPRNGYTSWN